MKNKIIRILIFLLALFSTAIICGCANFVVIDGIRMKDSETIDIAIGDFSYEGKKIIVEYSGGNSREVDITEDMIPVADRLKFYKVGLHEIRVIYNERYATSFNVNVQRRVFDDVFKLDGYTVTYDGNPHRVNLNRELPEGATAEFEYGNTFTNVGTYEISCVISKEGYVSKKLTTTLVIEKANYDESLIKMEDGVAVYDGEAKAIEVSGVPEGVSVTYDVYSGDIKVSRAINAGDYRVVAHFSSTNSNYNEISDRSATLHIEKADYDMSAVSFSDQTKNYDGFEYEPSLEKGSVLPQGVTVSYAVYKDGEKVTSNANAGEYEIVASFKGNETNYNLISDKRAKLTVCNRVIKISDTLSLDDITVNYDGQVHSLSLSGNLPQGVSVSFENNDHIYAGEYEVVAHFSATGQNDTVDLEEIRAFLIINQIRGYVQIDGHDITEEDMYYDKESQTMRLIGLDEEVYGIRSFKFYSNDDNGEQSVIDWGNLKVGKTYSYSISFYFKDENLNNSIRLSDATGNYTHREKEIV